MVYPALSNRNNLLLWNGLSHQNTMVWPVHFQLSTQKLTLLNSAVKLSHTKFKPENTLRTLYCIHMLQQEHETPDLEAWWSETRSSMKPRNNDTIPTPSQVWIVKDCTLSTVKWVRIKSWTTSHVEYVMRRPSLLHNGSPKTHLAGLPNGCCYLTLRMRRKLFSPLDPQELIFKSWHLTHLWSPWQGEALRLEPSLSGLPVTSFHLQRITRFLRALYPD